MRGGGDHLNNNTKHVDDTAENDGPLSADHVGKITSSDGTEEGTTRKNRSDEGGVALAQLGGSKALDGLVEDGRAIDTVDVTRVVTEEDTTERGEGAEQVGLPGDGGLDVLNIVGGVDGDGFLALLRALLLERVGHGDGGLWCCCCNRLLKLRDPPVMSCCWVLVMGGKVEKSIRRESTQKKKTARARETQIDESRRDTRGMKGEGWTNLFIHVATC